METVLSVCEHRAQRADTRERRRQERQGQQQGSSRERRAQREDQLPGHSARPLYHLSLKYKRREGGLTGVFLEADKWAHVKSARIKPS